MAAVHVTEIVLTTFSLFPSSVIHVLWSIFIYPRSLSQYTRDFWQSVIFGVLRWYWLLDSKNSTSFSYTYKQTNNWVTIGYNNPPATDQGWGIEPQLANAFISERKRHTEWKNDRRSIPAASIDILAIIVHYNRGGFTIVRYRVLKKNNDVAYDRTSWQFWNLLLPLWRHGVRDSRFLFMTIVRRHKWWQT